MTSPATVLRPPGRVDVLLVVAAAVVLAGLAFAFLTPGRAPVVHQAPAVKVSSASPSPSPSASRSPHERKH